MTTTFYEIPLSATPQSFGISVAGVSYTVTLTYADVTNGGWLVDLADSTGAAIVAGIPLVTGCDLLGQFKYLGLGFGLIVVTDGDASAVPTYENLGTSAHLYTVITS